LRENQHGGFRPYAATRFLFTAWPPGRAEADLADKYKKLICLRDPNLDPGRIPMPFAANDHIIRVGDMLGLVAALALKGAKPAHLRRDFGKL
jgi:hypothetical protein